MRDLYSWSLCLQGIERRRRSDLSTPYPFPRFSTLCCANPQRLSFSPRTLTSRTYGIRRPLTTTSSYLLLATESSFSLGWLLAVLRSYSYWSCAAAARIVLAARNAELYDGCTFCSTLSSAYALSLLGGGGSGASDVYIIYNVGERTDPWGVPDCRGMAGPTCSPMRIDAVRPSRNEDRRRRRGGGTSSCNILYRTPSCQILSKAFEMSRHRMLQLQRCATACEQRSYSRAIALCGLQTWRKPYWLGAMLVCK